MSGNKGSGWSCCLDRDGGSDGDRGGSGTKLESEGNESIGITAIDADTEPCGARGESGEDEAAGDDVTGDCADDVNGELSTVVDDGEFDEVGVSGDKGDIGGGAEVGAELGIRGAGSGGDSGGRGAGEPASSNA